MSEVLRRFLLAGVLLLSFTFGLEAAAAPRPFGINDLLKLEDIGKAAADPMGRWMVWEWAPPYEKQPDFSVGLNGTWEGAYQLKAVDLSALHPVAAFLFPPDSERQYWLDGFSPTGRYVLFYTARHANVGVGVYDFETRRVRYFEGAPDVSWGTGLEATWISNNAFVYSSHLGGGAPAVGLRRAYGEVQWSAWNKSWNGKEASVTTAISNADAVQTSFKAGRLLKVDARDGATEVLAEGLYQDLQVSHDGRFLAGLRQALRTQADPSVPDIDWTSSRSQLVLFDLKIRAPGKIIASDQDVLPRTLAWAPDRDRLAFFSARIGAGVRNGIFSTVDGDTGRVTAYPHVGLDLASERERGQFQKPERVLWLGDHLAIFARENTVGDTQPRFTYRDISGAGKALPPKADWFLVSAAGAHDNLTAPFANISAIPLYADGAAITVLADGAIWRISPAQVPFKLGGAAHPLALTAKKRSERLNRPFQSTMALLAADGDKINIAFADFVRGAVSEMPFSGLGADLLANASQTHAVLYREIDDAQNTVKLARGDATFTLQHLNPFVSGVARTQWTNIDYQVQAPEGTRPIKACMLLPPDFRSDRRYPVIVDVYPALGANACTTPSGRRGTAMDARPSATSDHLLAGKGYIVFKPNTASDLIATPDGPIAGITPVVQQGIDALIQAGYADHERVGLLGFSQGGFASLWMATQTNRFKAVVSMNSWSDMYLHYFDSDYKQRFFADDYPYLGNAKRYLATAGTDFAIGTTPQENLDAYVRNSSLFNAAKINTPALLIQSDLDGFSLQQYQAMFTALFQQRKEAKFLQYWGEGHAPSSPANIRNMWENIFGWYDRYLNVSRDKAGSFIWNGVVVRGHGAQTPALESSKP